MSISHTHTPPHTPPSVRRRTLGAGEDACMPTETTRATDTPPPAPDSLTPRQGRVLDALADFGKANRRRRPKSPPEKNLGNMLTI